MTLPQAFLRLPLAHRALHDIHAGRPENSRAAIRAAIDAGYGLEIDLQLSRDGQAMVFHDKGLKRLTGIEGRTDDLTAAELADICLLHGDEGIPTLPEILDLVAGRAPLLIEIKDQDGQKGPNIGALEQATADALKGYQGDVSVMSFNPYSVAKMRDLAPHIPRGLTTSAYTEADWPKLPEDVRARLRAMEGIDALDACFISHELADLGSDRVQKARDMGLDILCWTVASPEDEAFARQYADNITFEQYLAPFPA